MALEISIRPASGVPTKPDDRSVAVELRYQRRIQDSPDGAASVAQSVRIVLDASRSASATLDDASGNRVDLDFLNDDGSSALSRVAVASSSGVVDVQLSARDLDALRTPNQKLPSDSSAVPLPRAARLVPITPAAVDFTRCTLAVAPLGTAADWNSHRLGALFGSEGPITTSLDIGGRDVSALAGLQWQPSHVAVDGTFIPALVVQSGVGWLWWLTGQRQALGCVIDDLGDARPRTFALPLPAFSTDGASGAGDVRGRRTAPADVTEAEVANNPGIYGEDPGAFCTPFSNPERVLSERAFFTIARVTQPEIGPTASTNSRSVRLLQLDGDGPAHPAAVAPVPGAVAALGAVGRVAAATLPARHVLDPAYVGLIKTLPAGRTALDGAHPVQWEDDIAQYQAVTIALGHILEFRVRWRSNGYSLGNVVKTLTLAPRQVKRIQKIEWDRSERAQRTERTQLRDQVSDETVRERDYHDAVAANLSEWASGQSHSDTEAIAGGIGFFASGVLGGIGGGAGSSNSSSYQEGGRTTTASELQRLRDAIRRHGDSLRRLESTVVNEVTQEETVTGTTEVIRNPNYGHSLTVIYYQILRHLKVTTEFAGVRECVFVPFAIKAFDVQRAYRWRESIQASIRAPQYARALRYLKDVATNFATSDIPPGARAGQRLTYLRGSLYVSLAIERPRDADGKFDAGQWLVVQPLLGTPALGIFTALMAATEAQRDRAFQTDYAPGIAARWANRMQFRVGGRVLNADCTLASRYQFNRTVRIDFVIPAEELAGLTRQALQQLVVAPLHGLPPGSVANLTRLTLTYNTDRFERTVEGRTGVNDLITVATGAPESATVVLPLDDWERVDEQAEIRRSVNDLIEHLNEHVEYYHKAIWWRMDRDRLLMMLDGFFVPGTNNVSVASVVDREPIGIIGNSLVYRVGAASFLGYGEIKTPGQLRALYAEKEPSSDPVLVSLPTDGLYAQTIMDRCEALEEHYGNLDWILQQPEPDLGTIAPELLQSRRADTASSTQPTPFPSTIINLQNAPEAPPPAGLQGVLNAVTNPNAFRDMAGLAGTQANAMGALNTAANLATNFGNQAAALALAKLAQTAHATQTADQKLASVKRAVDKDLIDKGAAAETTRQILKDMSGTSTEAKPPHQDDAINAAIDTARSVPGSSVEASTADGSVKVQMGDGDGADGAGPGFDPTDVIFASYGGTSAVREHVVLVGGPCNWYNCFGKTDPGTGDFKLNPAPHTLGDVDDFINATKGNYTHDKYWANFLEPVPRLFDAGLVKPKANDIVTILVFYPPYLARQARDWAASPWNTQQWLDSPWVAGKAPYDPMVRRNDQGATDAVSRPPKAVPGAQPANDYATAPVDELRIDHEILMRATTEGLRPNQTYQMRPHQPTDWIDQIHNLPRRIVFGSQLGGPAKLKGVLVKILLVASPQQVLDYMATGEVTARRWRHLLDTVDEADMGNMDGPSLTDMADAWWDFAVVPEKPVPRGARAKVPPEWGKTPRVDRARVKIVRFDYFGHSNKSNLFLRYGWNVAKGDSDIPRADQAMEMSADDFNAALGGKNAVDKHAQAKLWGCSLGLDFADKFAASFPAVEAADSLTTFEELFSAPDAMPHPVSGGAWKDFAAAVPI